MKRKLTRRQLRKLLLQEVKLISEGFQQGEVTAKQGNIVFGNYTYKVSTSGMSLPVRSLNVNSDGTIKVAVKTPRVPFLSDGSVKKGDITDDLDKLKSLLGRGKEFVFAMKDDKGEPVKLKFSAV
tara:strand:- start:4427 stop:4801 length:375 start_codon:yes stop_codon:yes gene_type:complete